MTGWSCLVEMFPFASKMPAKPAPRGFAGAGGNSRWKERRRSVEGFDFQAQAGVVASLGRVATHEAVLVGLVLFADAAQGDPLAELAADPGVGALGIDDAGMALAEAVIAGTDGDVHKVAGQRRGDVEAAVDVAVFGLAVDLPVGTGGGAGDGDALADLDQRRVALGGLDLLAAAGTAVGGATDDADAILAVDLAAALWISMLPALVEPSTE